MSLDKINIFGNTEANKTNNIKAQNPIGRTFGIKGGESIKPLEKDTVQIKKHSQIPVKDDFEELTYEDDNEEIFDIMAANGAEIEIEDKEEAAKIEEQKLAFAQKELEDGDKALSVWQLQDAVESYTKAMDYGIENSEIYYKRGYANEYLSNFPEAIEDYTQSLKLGGDVFQNHVNRAQTEMYYMHSLPEAEKRGTKGKGLIKAAIADYGKALMTQIPEDKKEIVRKKILDDLIQTYDLDEEGIQYILTGEGTPVFGNLEFYREDYLEALDDFKNFIPYAEHPTALDLIAEVYAFYGDEGRVGASCYERSAELNEENLKNLQEKFKNAKSEEERENINQEIKQLKTTLANEYRLAGYYYKANEEMDWCMFDEKAFKYYKRGLELTGDYSADAYYRLGTVAPTHKERVEYLRKAIELAPEDPTYHEQLAHEFKQQIETFDDEDQEREFYHALGVHGQLDCREEVSEEALERAKKFDDAWQERCETMEDEIREEEGTATLIRIHQKAEEKKKTQQIQHTQAIAGA